MTAALGSVALAYAQGGWEVFPLRGKVPALACPITKANRATGLPACEGGCGHDGHGVLDATSDEEKVRSWWTMLPNANIGGRVPAGVVVVDIDPRSGGGESLAEIERIIGPLVTRTAYSGRGDGGRHFYFRHPGGKLDTRSWPGVDLKDHRGYCVLPPSRHPDTDRPYEWGNITAPIEVMPFELVEMLRPAVITPRRMARSTGSTSSDSIADWYSANHDFADLLLRHQWSAVNAEGTKWKHPTATSEVSATIKHDCLFVYSPNTPFEQTSARDPHGYTVFRAWAVLEHGNDLRAAALAARGLRDARAVAA